jgi:uncharacterized protein YggE
MSARGCRCLIVVLLLVATAATAGELESRHVTAYGTATIQVTPDQMKWRLLVRNMDLGSARQAAEDHAKRVGAVIEFLKDNRIEEKTIQTSGMRLGETWKHEYGERVLEGYTASTDVTFVLNDFDRYTDLWLGLAELPAVSVQGIELDHSDRISFQNEARVDAVLAAREKAEAMAAALGVHIGKPLAVEEEPSLDVRPFAREALYSNTMASAGGPAEADQSVAPGSIPIRVRVKVVFKLIDGD